MKQKKRLPVWGVVSIVSEQKLNNNKLKMNQTKVLACQIRIDN